MSDSETCHVVVLGFDPQLEPPAARLQRVFGLDRATCEALLENLPATVQRSVPRVRAEYFRRALASIGAQVEVRTPEGELIEPPSEAAPASQPVAAPVTPPHEPAADPRAAAVALHHAPTEPLPPLLQVPSEWSAQPSPWAAQPSPWAAQPSQGAVDPTSRTLAQAAGPAPLAPAGAAAAPLGWEAPSPWSGEQAPAGPAEPTALAGPPRGMPAPAGPPPQPAAWPAAPSPIPQPEVRAPAAPTLREGAHAGRGAPVAAEAAAGAASPTPFAAPSATPAPYGAAQHAATHAAPLPAASPTAFGGSAPFAPAPAHAAYASPGEAVPFGAAPAASPFGALSAAPPAAAAWGGALDLGSLKPAQPAPFDLSAGSAPLPGPPAAGGAAPTGGIGSRLRSDIWDAPADSPASGGRDPSGIFDPPASPSPRAGLSVPVPAPSGSPAARPSSRPGGVRPSTPPPPAALDRALRSSPPPAAPPPADAAGFQVLHGWDQLRDEFKPGMSRPAPRAPGPTSGAPPQARPGARPGVSPQPGASAARPTARSVQGADLRSFWESFGDALALPFTGPGPYWIAAITVWSVAVSLLGLLAGFMFLLGLVVSFCAQTSLVAMACDYYRVCFWAPAVSEKTLDRAPDFDPVRIMGDYVGRGLHLSFFVLLSQVAAIAWVVMSIFDGTEPTDLLLDPITWVLFFFPYFYWPMGVALTALRNDFGGIWHVVVGVRAIARAPLEYFVVVLTGFAVLAVSATALFLFGSMLGLTGAVLSGTLGLPLALSHGIQGALMGHLARARAEIFED